MSLSSNVHEEGGVRVLINITIMFIIMVAMMLIEGLRMSSSVHEEDRGHPTNGNPSFPAQTAAATRT